MQDILINYEEDYREKNKEKISQLTFSESQRIIDRLGDVLKQSRRTSMISQKNSREKSAEIILQ